MQSPNHHCRVLRRMLICAGVCALVGTITSGALAQVAGPPPGTPGVLPPGSTITTPITGSSAAAGVKALGMSSMIETFRRVTSRWIDPIAKIASSIFWTLALFEFTLTFGKMALTGSDAGEYIAELFKRIVFISFGWWLLTNPLLFINLITGLWDVGKLATGDSASAGGIISFDGDAFWERTLMMFDNIMDLRSGLNWLNVPGQLVVILVALFVLWALGTIIAQIILVMCEMYVVMIAGLVSMGFWSFAPTKEYPMRYIGGMVGTGVKLMTLQLIAGLAFELVTEWSQIAGNFGIGGYVALTVGALALKELAVKVPDYMQSLLGGAPGSGLNASQAVAGGIAAVAAPMALAASGSSIAASAAKAATGGAGLVSTAVSAASKVKSGQLSVGEAAMGAGKTLGKMGLAVGTGAAAGIAENLAAKTVTGKIAAQTAKGAAAAVAAAPPAAPTIEEVGGTSGKKA